MIAPPPHSLNSQRARFGAEGRPFLGLGLGLGLGPYYVSQNVSFWVFCVSSRPFLCPQDGSCVPPGCNVSPVCPWKLCVLSVACVLFRQTVSLSKCVAMATCVLFQVEIRSLFPTRTKLSKLRLVMFERCLLG